MVLNYIWIALIVIAILAAFIQFCISGDASILNGLVDSTFSSAKSGFEISLYLTGVLSLWLGIMRVGEKGGAVQTLSRIVSPFFVKIFPEIPRGHKAFGSIVMNLSANMLGLDNAATPMGLRAMKEMQELNTQKDTATNAQIMFLVLNTSGLTIIPISIIAYRTQCGAANPTDVFLPILITTFFSTLAGLIATAIVQRINLLNRTVIAYLGGLSALVAMLLYLITGMEPSQVEYLSNVASASILLSIILGFILLGLIKRINVYEAFIDGAKEGFSTAIQIIPFLIAILVAVGLFRASGALDLMIEGIRYIVGIFSSDTRFVDALPTAFMKPLSGSGARGFMIECMNTYGADSFVGRLSCLFQGAADTTFYILAVYFGSVGIKNTRHAVGCGLLADLVGIVVAIIICSLFFS
ncbi:MAG: nucleoside recognition domain-containing protein [Bacteroidia bacterium]|nr:nucleoside recognition domain-containing protein [Bacteroidia bacterium]